VSNGRKTANRQERIWKDAVTDYFKIPTQHSSGGSKTTKPQDSHNTNPEPLEL
jgi:hypothetical protein